MEPPLSAGERLTVDDPLLPLSFAPPMPATTRYRPFRLPYSPPCVCPIPPPVVALFSGAHRGSPLRSCDGSVFQYPHTPFFFNEIHFFRVARQQPPGKPKGINGNGFKKFP